MTEVKKSLAEAYPDIASEWDYEKNNGLTPIDVTAGSNKKIWWKCEKGHSYDCAVDHRTNRKQGCPYCSGKRILSGYNDLKTRNPLLAEEWDYEKNGEISPEMISLNSHLKYWWKCRQCQYEWLATPNDRSRGRNCPICAKEVRKETRARTLIVNRAENVLANNKELLKEWDYGKNTNIDPAQILAGSSTKVWWKCNVCGNSWSAAINNRANGSGCPKCMKHMQTSFPEQAICFYLKQGYKTVYNSYTDVFDNKMELDIFISDINTGIEYDGVAFHTGNIATRKMEEKYNLCKANGIKLIRVSEFNNNSRSYDICIKRKDHTDEALNDAISELLDKLNINEISVNVQRDRPQIMRQYITNIREKSLSNRFPEIAKKWDIEKNGGLLPDQVSAYSNKKYWWRCQLGHSYQATPMNEVTDTKNCPVCSNHRVLEGFNDLAFKLPELAKEWDYSMNDSLKPNEIVYSSSKKVWWICPRGHHFEATIESRFRGGTGCPYCTNSKVLSGYNDLATLYPDLLNEWNYERNDGIKPSEIIPGSNKKYWWKCSLGHEWEATPNSRTGKNHSGCPFCSNQKVLMGYNDLATKNPELLIEWDYEKNSILDPKTISPGSSQKVWWKCKTCGNEWKCGVINRTHGQKTGCPKCGYKLKIQKTRTETIKREKKDICSMFPEIAKEWDYEKNMINPSETSYGANVKVWWTCPQGHSYQAWLSDRTGKHKTGCPYCSGKRRMDNITISNPELLNEWDFNKNGLLKPESFGKNNHTKIWWLCSKGHSFQSEIATRTSEKNKGTCPICSNHQVLTGFNDLQTIYPDIAREWDNELNNELSPNNVVYGSSKIVWWKCSQCGFKWKSTIVNRTRQHSGCPNCNMNRMRTPIVCIETNESFESIKEASAKTGIRTEYISRNLKGIKDSAGGYHWKYLE